MKRLQFLLLGCALATVIMAARCKDGKETPATTTASPAVEEPVVSTPPPVDPCSAENLQTLEAPKLAEPEAGSKNARVRIKTQFGDMVVKLYDETPWHRDNFLQLVNKKYYDCTLFHRCIKGFMVQGGDPLSRTATATTQLGMGGPGYTIPAEFNPNLIHKRGALSAARQGDAVNPQRQSSGSQFYIVQGTVLNDMQLTEMEMRIGRKMPGFKYTDQQKEIYKTAGGTAQLDMDYTVFGEVIEGLDIIDSIAAMPTMRDRPLQDIRMMMEIVR